MMRDFLLDGAFGTYIAASVPGWLVTLVITFFFYSRGDLPLWGAIAIVTALIGTDLWLFPRHRHYYTSEPANKRMIGERGVALSDLAPRGFVRVHGELWHAQTMRPEQTIHEGDYLCDITCELGFGNGVVVIAIREPEDTREHLVLRQTCGRILAPRGKDALVQLVLGKGIRLPLVPLRCAIFAEEPLDFPRLDRSVVVQVRLPIDVHRLHRLHVHFEFRLTDTAVVIRVDVLEPVLTAQPRRELLLRQVIVAVGVPRREDGARTHVFQALFRPRRPCVCGAAALEAASASEAAMAVNVNFIGCAHSPC
jgi:membrane protein implicated in regulation of membrane protease activity